MNVVSSINARSLAQEISAQYFSNLDPYESHRTNVGICLRKPVTAVTIHLLTNANGEVEALKASEHAAFSSPSDLSSAHPDDSGLVNHAEVKDCGDQNGGGSHTAWQDPLAMASNVVEIDLLEADFDRYNGLHRRSKARMKAFLEGVALAVTSSGKQTVEGKQDISLEDGLTGFMTKPAPRGPAVMQSLNLTGQKLFRSISSSESSAKKAIQEQIEEIDLITRLELYIRCLCRVKTQGIECVLPAEPSRALRARAQAIVTSFVRTVSTVRQQSPILTRLLVSLTKELLAVEYISPDLLRTIRRLVSDYEQQTSFASLAFLSTPDDSAEQRLTPMVTKYMKFLQSSWENQVMDCELERMLTLALDKHMRKTFKTIEFRSIGHLLETCADFRPQLHKIELAPTCLGDLEQLKVADDPDTVLQAIRDLQRERITVNGHLLPPVTDRDELVQLLQQTMNSRTLTALPLKARRNSRRLRRKNGNDSVSESSHGKNGNGSLPAVNSESDLTSGVESDAVDRGTAREQKPRRRNFHVSMIDALTKRLLVAASRTGTGGDAFFVVKDLFGGDEVEVMPSEVLPTHGRAVRPGTIEILVRLASVTIKSHASFDVYPKGMVRACEPLIQLHTTTTEIISLQEVRASDSMDEGNNHPDNYETDESETNGREAFMVLQEKEFDKSGWRTLQIRPALYEKVESWNTPS